MEQSKNTTLSTAARGGIKTSVPADHRNGICIECEVQMEVKEVTIQSSRIVEGKTIYTDKLVKRPVCPKCGGMIGQLIARSVSIQPPPPPQCVSPRCLFKFVLDTLFCALLSSYHARRMAYAEKNRHNKILERYRTGEPSPKNIWQAIHANIKLKCPICRKYNIDPFLGGKRNGSNTNLD